MRKNYYPKMIFPAIILMIFTTSALAQWPANSDSNMVLCDRFGDQAVPKIAATSDGGCYICWYDHASGNYDVYMQRLNGDGEIQWAPGGMLISNHSQDTWLTDWDMTVDGDDHAIVVFNDIRAGGDWDIYAYRISPAGNFVWGDNGLTLSDNTNFEADAVVAVTSSGNFVFGWMDDTMVYLRKVNSAGIDMWSPHTITLSSTYGLAKPQVVPAENDGVVVSVMLASGPMFWDPQHLYAHKFDSLGAEQWGSGGVAINAAGGIALYMNYDLTSDGAGGAYSFWYDDRDMSLNAYVQHILSDGVMAWTANGVQVSLAAGELQMNPSLVHFPSSNEVLVFYLATDFNQTLNGVHGQKLDSLGALQWGSNGIAFVPMSNQTRSHISAQAQTDGAIIVYKEFAPGSAILSYIKAIRVDMDGNPVWTTSPVDMCSFLSGKGRIPTTVSPTGRVIAAWDDARLDINGDMYLQNINPDGTLGPSGSSGCEYVVGDVNGSDSYNGLDITYGVAFFKGGAGPLCPDCPVGDCNSWNYCGDVNASCSYNGLDITYGVAYFKGGADPMFCADCSPVE